MYPTSVSKEPLLSMLGPMQRPGRRAFLTEGGELLNNQVNLKAAGDAPESNVAEPTNV